MLEIEYFSGQYRTPFELQGFWKIGSVWRHSSPRAQDNRSVHGWSRYSGDGSKHKKRLIDPLHIGTTVVLGLPWSAASGEQDGGKVGSLTNK